METETLTVVIWAYIYLMGVLGVYAGMLNRPELEKHKGWVFVHALFFPVTIGAALVWAIVKTAKSGTRRWRN